MDIMTPTQRYKAMVHNRDRTKPERILASSLWRAGLRYLTDNGYKHRYGNPLPGHPDIVFSKKQLAIFVDGCFWHGCPECRKHTGLRGDFWVGKIETNKQRDQRVTAQLESQGWVVLRIPEHDILTKARLLQTIDWLTRLVRADFPSIGGPSVGDHGA